MLLPQLVIKDFRLESCIFQGGMGVGVSLHPLAGAVSKEGGLGIVSSACLRTIVSKREGKPFSNYAAVRNELERAQSASGGKPIGINIMRAVIEYEDTVRAAIDAGVSAIISGAGLPLSLPTIKPPGHTALIPIVSSARALKIILRSWEKASYRPDAVVLEGPLAGGHLGFKLEEIDDPAFALENLLVPVLEIAHLHGDIPVVVAGGIYTHEDILRFLGRGARAVQVGTRFLATEESSATDSYKKAVVDAGKDDITVVAYPDAIPASPCGLPFRILRTSPMYLSGHKVKCKYGYVKQRKTDGKLVCQAMPEATTPEKFVCICLGLLSSAGYEEGPNLYTVGTNAYRINKVIPVAELMRELRGE